MVPTTLVSIYIWVCHPHVQNREDDAPGYSPYPPSPTSPYPSLVAFETSPFDPTANLTSTKSINSVRFTEGRLLDNVS